MKAVALLTSIGMTLILYVSLMSMCFTQLAFGGSVRLAWDPNTEVGLEGYRLYYGTASRQYDSEKNCGNETTCYVSNLDEGTYYFALKAYSSGGVSDFSNEVVVYISENVDEQAPVISNVSGSGLEKYGATITWTTHEPSDTQVEYGITENYGNSTDLNSNRTTSHSQSISGLSAGTQYHFRVKSRDAAGNLAYSGDYTLITSDEEDLKAPIIYNILSSNVLSTSAVILWITDEFSDSQIDFGITAGYGSSTSLYSARATMHSAVLTGLTPNTLYHFRVKSRDDSGNLAISDDYTFTTIGSSAPPDISGITVANITSKSARIAWNTSTLSDTEVEYWTAGLADKISALRQLTTVHSLTLNQLQKDTIYYYRVKSTKADGSCSMSAESSFRTAMPADTALVWPRFSSGLGLLGTHTMTGLAITNLDSASTDVMFTAFENDGIFTSGQDISNPTGLTPLLPKEQIPIIDWEIFGSGLLDAETNGWIMLESSRPYTDGFFMIFDSSLRLMDGANLTDTKCTDLVFPEIQTDGYNKISIINHDTEAATMTAKLVAADGSVRRTKTQLIYGNGVLTTDLFAEFFGGIKPDATDYVRVHSNIGVHAFQVARQQTGDISTLEGQDLSAGGTVLYAPQYVIGGPWQARLSIINLDSVAGMVQLRFISEEGVPLGVTRATSIPANGKLYIDDPGYFLTLPPGGIAVGYVQIISDGIRLTGSVAFGDIRHQTYTSTLALISSLQTSILYSQVASNDMYYTGIAILNPNPITATVTLELYSAGGTLIDEIDVVIQGGQRKARVLSEYFAYLEENDQTGGYVRLTSDLPIASYAVFGTNNSTVLSALPPLIIQ